MDTTIAAVYSTVLVRDGVPSQDCSAPAFAPIYCPRSPCWVTTAHDRDVDTTTMLHDKRVFFATASSPASIRHQSPLPSFNLARANSHSSLPITCTPLTLSPTPYLHALHPATIRVQQYTKLPPSSSSHPPHPTSNTTPPQNTPTIHPANFRPLSYSPSHFTNSPHRPLIIHHRPPCSSTARSSDQSHRR